MDTQKLKEGLSVKEIEHFAKRYRFEIFCCLALLLAGFFSFIFFTGWSPALAALGGILGILIAEKIELFFNRSAFFIHKQEDITQLVLGIAGLVLSVFLPMVTFFILGAAGGKHLRGLVIESPRVEKENAPIEK